VGVVEVAAVVAVVSWSCRGGNAASNDNDRRRVVVIARDGRRPGGTIHAATGCTDDISNIRIITIIIAKVCIS
jgi:hypothetical protein